MTSLASIIILLQTALSLLGAAQANPSLPQSVRDNAVYTAQQAIAQATAAIAQTSGTSASCVNLTSNLSLGSSDATSGGQVTQLQHFLGLNPATGYFGPVTEKALQTWQASHGIVSSGSAATTGFGAVGLRTRGALACKPATPVPPPTGRGGSNGGSGGGSGGDRGGGGGSAPSHPVGDRMVFDQGDLNKVGKTVDEVAQQLAKYDVVQLTNGFSMYPANGTYGHAAPGDRYGLNSVNGQGLANAYTDANGRHIDDLMARIRQLNPNVKIYVYVAATVDNPWGAWTDVQQGQNYNCPGGVCTDFIHMVDKWRSLEDASKGVIIDGFFVDMVNEFYTSVSTWANDASYIHALTNAVGQPYKIMANTLTTEPTYFYANGGSTLVASSKRPILFTAAPLHSGDSVLLEGFYLVNGTKMSQTQLDAIYADVAQIATSGVTWDAIVSQYKDTLGWTCAEQDWYDAYYLSQQHGRRWITYGEANLGATTGVLSCFHW